jgi:hypothetical protein
VRIYEGRLREVWRKAYRKRSAPEKDAEYIRIFLGGLHKTLLSAIRKDALECSEADPLRERESKKRREGDQQPRMITEDDTKGDICRGWKVRGAARAGTLVPGGIPADICPRNPG